MLYCTLGRNYGNSRLACSRRTASFRRRLKTAISDGFGFSPLLQSIRAAHDGSGAIPPAVSERNQYYIFRDRLCQAKPVPGRYFLGAPRRSPASAGFVGERRSSEISLFSPKTETNDVKLAPTLSSCGLGAWPGRLPSESGKICPACAVRISPSLRSRLHYAPILRSYINLAPLTLTPGPMVEATTQLLIY